MYFVIVPLKFVDDKEKAILGLFNQLKDVYIEKKCIKS